MINFRCFSVFSVTDIALNAGIVSAFIIFNVYNPKKEAIFFAMGDSLVFVIRITITFSLAT